MATNKDRLDALSAKLKETQETLNNKVLSLKEKGVTIELPDEFSNCTHIYYFIADNSCVLVSGLGVENIGVWRHNLETNDWVNLYSAKNNWRYFQIVGDYILISGSGNSQGILSYSIKEETISLIYSNSYDWSYFLPIEDKVLIGGGSNAGLLRYDPITNSIEKAQLGGSTRPLVTFGKKCLVLGTNYSTGLFVYNYDTNSTTKIYETGSTWYYFKVIGNKCLISSNTLGEDGVLLFNSNDDTIVKLYDTNYKWDNFFQIGSDCLITGTMGIGVLFYNDELETIEQLYSTKSKWNIFKQVTETKYLLASDNSSGGTGILLFNHENKTITQIYSNYYNWNIFQKVGDKWLIARPSNSLLRYNSNEDSCIQIDSASNVEYFKVIGNTCLYSSSSSTAGVSLYDADTDTKTKLYSSSIGWKYYQEVKGGYIIACQYLNSQSVSAGLLFYDKETRQISKIYSYGNYGKFIPDGNNFYVTIADEQKDVIEYCPRTLYYNADNRTVKLVKYYIGEV